MNFKNVGKLNPFDRICLKLQLNFFDRASKCYWGMPKTPSFTKPIAKDSTTTKYFALLKSMKNGPIKASSICPNYQQQFRWSGMCKSTKDGYVLSDLGYAYIEMAEWRHKMHNETCN